VGASGAYGGSGGRAWGRVRDQAGEYADNPSSENARELLSDIADALDWDSADDAPDFSELRPVVARPRLGGAGGGGDGPGGAGGRATGGGGGQQGGGGGRRRSRARAAAVGGSAAAAGLAFRGRDEDTLRRFGLSLAELDGLDAHEQARRILDAVSGSVAGTQEDELQHAAGVALLALLDEGATAEDAVREFVTDYVFEVSITEVGDELRDGTRDGYTTVDQEDQLRDLIETSVNQLDLPDRLDADNIQEVIYKALDDARTFLRAEE
jgi:hypothetical protein